MTQPVVFISYSRQDEAEKEMLMSHLGVLQVAAGLIDLWNDARIGAGQDWQASIDQAIAQSKVAVLLITANFLNSEFILRTEVPALLKRREQENLVVLPIIARACAWRAVDWLHQMEKSVKPRDGVAIWREGGIHIDEDLSDIAQEIVDVIKPKMNGSVNPAPVTKPNSFVSIDEISFTKPDKPRRILVVDDEPTWQRRLSRILHEIECLVVTAGSYEQVEGMLSHFDFDLVTIDLNLDKATQYADGLELALRLRQTLNWQIPIVIITGTGNMEGQRRAFKEYGVVDFIEKAKFDSLKFQAFVMKATNVA